MFRTISKGFVIKIIGLFSSLLISLIISRKVGVEGVGIMALINKGILILFVISSFGFQNALVKLVSIAHNKADFHKVNSLLFTSLKFTTLTSIILIISFTLIVYLLYSDNPNLTLYLVGILGLLPLTISRIFSSALNGIGKIWESILINQNLTNVLIVFILIVSILFNLRITILFVVLLYLFVRIINLIFGFKLWSFFSIKTNSNLCLLKEMLPVSVPLFLTSSSQIATANIDALILGIFSSIQDVGVYSIASRIALLSGVILQVSNTFLMPKLANLFHTKEYDKAAKLYRFSTLILSIIAILFFLIIFVYGDFLLSFWGDDFISGYYILLTLSAGQVINLISGSSGVILIMSGHEIVQAKIAFIGLLLTIILNYIMINVYGAIGAAIATSSCIFLINVSKFYFVAKLTNLKIFKS